MRRAQESLLKSLWSKSIQLLSGASGRLAQVTGLLGLVTIFLFFYTRRNKAAQQPRSQAQSSAAAAANQNGSSAGQQSGSVAGPSKSQRDAPTQLASIQSNTSGVSGVSARLAGVKSITISAPGVLLQQGTTQELQRGAIVRSEVIELLREILKCCAVYVITQVEGDEGEAACRGALEAEGLIGNGPAQVPPQRLLFCSTLEGKTSIVRQIDPQIHFDGHPHTIEELKRFMRLVHVFQPGQEPAGKGFSSTQHAPSLKQYFS